MYELPPQSHAGLLDPRLGSEESQEEGEEGEQTPLCGLPTYQTHSCWTDTGLPTKDHTGVALPGKPWGPYSLPNCMGEREEGLEEGEEDVVGSPP